jgi:hypothetical protein
METGQLLMTQRERDRLVVLKAARKRLRTQKEAAAELDVSERQVRRLLRRLREQGDKSVIHGLRGKPSNRRIDPETEQRAIEILSEEIYEGFGPTMASEYLRGKRRIQAGRETVRQWMIRGKLWRGRKQKMEQVHVWRPRRSRRGELVQWDTSEHAWLEGRGKEPEPYLIAMIDDASSRVLARFVRHDSTEENMRLLWRYLERWGRPRAYYTDKASLFQTNRPQQREEQLRGELPKTQIGRALEELGIQWIAAHSPQAKGRIERFFGTAQDRLVKGMRLAGVKNIDQANEYLEKEFLPWWERTRTVEPGDPQDAHRPLEKTQKLAAVLSRVETRQVRNDYTVRFQGQHYQIERKEITGGLRGAMVRVEQRLDGSMAVRFRGRYLAVKRCGVSSPPVAEEKMTVELRRKKPLRGSDWNKNFDLKKAPKIWQAAQSSGYPAAEWRS